jgi:hypothetical protein
MATILRGDQSLNQARQLKKEEQEEALKSFVADLQRIYGFTAIGVTGSGSNRELSINVNKYLESNPDLVFEVVISEIKGKINDFCSSNSALKFTYTGDTEGSGGAAESKSSADGRKRKIKRSPSKKSIKSKRKY